MSDITKLIDSYEELQFHFDDEEELKKKSIENYLYYTFKKKTATFFSKFYE